MKKIMSILLSVLLVFGVAVIPMNAAQADKLSHELNSRLDEMTDDEKIDVRLGCEFHNYPSREEILVGVKERTDIDPGHFNSTDEVRDYYAVWRSVRDELYHSAVLDAMETLGVTLDDVIGEDEYTMENIGRKGLPWCYSLSKEHILSLTDLSEVIFIDLYIPEEIDEPITPVIKPEDKLNDALKAKLDTMSDTDKAGVWAWCYDISDEEVTDLMIEAYGEDFVRFGDVLQKHSARTKVLSDYHSHKNADIVARLEIEDESDILFLSILSPSFILKLTKAQILELAAMDEISWIDFYETELRFYDEIPGDSLYADDLMNWYDTKSGLSGGGGLEIYAYKELCTAYDEAGDPSYAIIYAPDNMMLPWEVKTGGIVGRRVIYVIGGGGLFTTGYALYDIKAGEFYDLTSVKAEDYEGLAQAVEVLRLGNPVGDVNFDGELSILDATRIQRVLAQLDDKEFCSGFSWDGVADYDADGRFTILDATAIQNTLAHFDNSLKE